MMTATKRAVLRGLLGAACAMTIIPAAVMAQDKGVIGIAVADQKSLFYVAALDGMKAAAEAAGYKVVVAVANNDSAEQVNQVQNLLVQNIAALVFISQDSTAAAAGVKAANKAGVPVIAVDQRPESGQGTIATYIATDSVKAANQLCTWMFEKMGKKGNIAILHGVAGSTAEIQRTQGCQDALKNYPDIKVVAEQTANWDETEAFKATQNILTANPDLAAVFAESDAMSLGAAKAAREAGRTDLISVGIDGFPTMLDGIKAGLTQATMAQTPYKMGQMGVEAAIKVMNGETLPELQYQDTVMVTADNAATIKASDFYGPAADAMK